MLHQFVQGQIQQITATAGVNHHLADIGVELGHGVDVHPVARHARRFLVLGQDAAEALAITFGLGDNTGPVAFSLFRKSRSGTAGLRNDVVGIGLPFVLQALPVGPGLERIVERCLHLLGRLDALDIDIHDQNAGLETIQLYLDQLDQVHGDGIALLVQHGVHRAAADDLPHGRFSGLQNRLFHVAVLEEEILRLLQAPLHREADVDDVLVLREHRRVAQTRRLHHGSATDLGRSDLRDADSVVRLEWTGPAVLDAGIHGAAEFSEREDDGLLAFLHDEESAAQPQQCSHAQDQPAAQPEDTSVRRAVRTACRRLAAAIPPARCLATKQAAEFLVEIAPEFVQVGRTIVAPGVGHQIDTREAALRSAQLQGQYPDRTGDQIQG